MGRKTWESLPRRPLPGRPNIVVTRNADYVAEGAIVAHDIDAAVAKADELARQSGASEIAVIGGAEIFASLVGRARRIYLTEVDLDVPGDTFFPALAADEWRETGRAVSRPRREGRRGVRGAHPRAAGLKTRKEPAAFRAGSHLMQAAF